MIIGQNNEAPRSNLRGVKAEFAEANPPSCQPVAYSEG
jgi:hypothetical protein